MKNVLAYIIIAFALVISGSAVIPSNVCYAEVHYANDDSNYPIWAAGSHYGRTYDLSSCFIYDEDDNYVIVKTIGYTYSWAGHELSEPTDTYFRMDKSSHNVWYRQLNSKWYHPESIFNDAIQLAFSKVGRF